MKNEIIPIFFTIDDNYIPFFKIAIKSIMDNSNSTMEYELYILHSSISDKNKKEICDMLTNNFKCQFIDISEKIQFISNKLFTRDYYSKTTYYRLFIPNMFPNLDKAIYIDSDIVVNRDISELFNFDLKDNLIGAIADESVQIVDEFILYVEKYLGIPHQNYFNAGVLVMNLSELRKFNFEDKFISLLNQIKFSVAQDQDYLNVLCKNRVLYLPLCWNKMPFENNKIKKEEICLVHYNLSFKPWHYDNILYEEYFYKYSNELNLTNYIENVKNNFSDKEKEMDRLGGENLKKMAKIFSNENDTFASLLSSGRIKI